MKVTLRKSPNPEKKYRVTFEDGSHVDFGGAGYSDYTIHKDPSRMKRYLARHGRMGETWSKAGLKTCLLYTSPSPRDRQKSRMPSSA